MQPLEDDYRRVCLRIERGYAFRHLIAIIHADTKTELTLIFSPEGLSFNCTNDISTAVHNINIVGSRCKKYTYDYVDSGGYLMANAPVTVELRRLNTILTDVKVNDELLFCVGVKEARIQVIRDGDETLVPSQYIPILNKNNIMPPVSTRDQPNLPNFTLAGKMVSDIAKKVRTNRDAMVKIQLVANNMYELRSFNAAGAKNSEYYFPNLVEEHRTGAPIRATGLALGLGLPKVALAAAAAAAEPEVEIKVMRAGPAINISLADVNVKNVEKIVNVCPPGGQVKFFCVHSTGDNQIIKLEYDISVIGTHIIYWTRKTTA